MTWFPLLSEDGEETALKIYFFSLFSPRIYAYDSRKLAYQFSVNCDVIYGFLKCSLPADTIDVDLEVRTPRRIHTYKKNYNTWTVSMQPIWSRNQSNPQSKKGNAWINE